MYGLEIGPKCQSLDCSNTCVSELSTYQWDGRTICSQCFRARLSHAKMIARVECDITRGHLCGRCHRNTHGDMYVRPGYVPAAMIRQPLVCEKCFTILRSRMAAK